MLTRILATVLCTAAYTCTFASTTFETNHSADTLLYIEPATDYVEMDEIVVSANRNAVRRCEAPVVVSVLSNKLFETVSSTDLAQSLSYQTGLRVENNCQNCGFPQLRINGLEGPYTQILINSRPVVSSLSGVYALEQMPVNMVERIEVVRGGGSALFGANAIAGTVNIITKQAINNHFEAGSSIQCINSKAWEESFNANATLVSADGSHGITLYESNRHRSPYDHDGDSFSETGKLNSNTLGANVFYRFDEYKRVTIEYHNTYEFRRGGNKFNLEPFQTDITEQTEHYINSGGINYTQNWRDFTRRLNLYASAQHIGRSSYYGAQQNPDAYGKTADFTGIAGAVFSADFEKVLLSPATLTAGAEYQTNRLHDIMTGYGRDMRQSVDIMGIYAQNEWKTKHVTFLAGARLDKHNLIERPIVSPRLNLLYRPANPLQLRATWSTGFRAPQAYDEDLHVTAVGGEGIIIKLVPGLKPEKSNSFSVSADFDHNFGPMDVDILVEAFHTQLSNVFIVEMIGQNADGFTIKERRNGSGAKVYGVNTDLKFIFGPHSLSLGITAQRSRYTTPERWSDDETISPTRQMPRTPDLYGYFTLSAEPIKNWECSLSGVYTGHMFIPHYAPDPTQTPSDYQIEYIAHDTLSHSPQFFELGAKIAHTFKLKKNLDLQIGAGVKNITNSFQRDLDRGAFRDSGYFYGPAYPRSYHLTLKFTGI